MTETPGAYLRGMRLAASRSYFDVAELLRMLRLCGQSRVWPGATGLEQLLQAIERGEREPTRAQLASLSLVIHDFRPARYRELVRLRLKEAVDG